MRSISASGRREPAEGRQRAPHEESDDSSAERGREYAREEHEEMEARKRLLQVVRRGSDDHCTAGRRATELGQGRGVDTHSFVAEACIRVTGAARADRTPGSRVGGEHPTAERQRARHDAAPRVDDLDGQLSSTEGRVERTGCGQQCRRGGIQLCDLDRSLPQRVIERVMKVA